MLLLSYIALYIISLYFLISTVNEDHDITLFLLIAILILNSTYIGLFFMTAKIIYFIYKQLLKCNIIILHKKE